MKISSITKNGKKAWRVSWQDEHRQRRNFFKTKQKAEAFATTLDKSDPTFQRWLALPESARMDALIAAEIAKTGRFSLIEAARFFDRQSGKTDRNTAVAWAEFIAVKRDIQKSSEESIRNARIAGRFLDHYRDRDVSEITTGMVEEWINSHEWAPSSINSFTRHLSVFLNWCISRGYLTNSPVKPIPRSIESENAVGILTAAHARQLMRACEKHDRELIPIAALGLFCGLRPSECRRLAWESVDLRRRIIHMSASHARKTRKGRIVHLTPNAAAWLKLGGEMNPINFRNRWDIIRDHAGLVKRTVIGGKRYKVTEIHWPKDCLRHSFASHYTPLHGIPSAAMECGNSEQVQIKHYRLPLPKADCRKYFGIMPA